MKIYVVKGSTGLYEDYSEWNVKAFREHDQAIKFMEEAQEWADTHSSEDRGPDPFFNKDYDKTWYEVEQLELV